MFLRRVLPVVLLLAIGVAVGFAPRLGAESLAGRGVTVAGAGWCAPGVCLTGIVAEGVEIDFAELRWDRAVRLHGVRVAADRLRAVVSGGPAAGGAGEGGAAAGLDGLAGLVTRVEVEELTVPDAPLPVPPLAGEVWPERRLEGEGVSIRGDEVQATLATELGEARVVVRPEAGGLVGEVRCVDCRMVVAALDGARIALPELVARGTWRAGRVDGVVEVGEVAAVVEGTVGASALDVRVRVDRAPIAAAFALLGEVVPEARRARIEGVVGGEARVVRAGPDAAPKVSGVPTVDGFAVSGVVPPGYAAGPFQWRTRDAAGAEVLRTGGEGSASWTPLSEVGELLPAAIVAAEDAGFWGHPGYELQGMLAAAADNEARGEVWRGGSTLTQQLAKNLFLDGERTYVRKLRELLYAVDLERTLGKRRIMELYVNVVEWGPGIYGAREAAQVFFLKQPRSLLPEEAAWLASILPRPRSAYSSEYLRERPRMERVRAVLDSMRTLSDEAREAAKARPLRFVPP